MLNETARAAAHYTYSDTRSLDAAISDYLAAVVSGDVAGLVERLRFNGRHLTEDRQDAEARRFTERSEAASLIQLQAARITQLEANLSRFVDICSDIRGEWIGARHLDAGLLRSAHADARRLLNGERKG